MNTKRAIKVRWLRFLKRTNNLGVRVLKTHDLSDPQKMGIKIFEKTVSIKDAEIFLSPLSDTIYIEVNDIYVILDGNDLQIINGKFQYDLHFSDGVRSKLVARVYSVLEGRRIKVEQRIRAKSERTLSSIMADITEIKEKESIR
jgi:hypothetical protein